MRGVLFLLAFAALPAVGFPFLTTLRVVPESRAARVAAAAVCGATMICAEMFLLTCLRIRWTLPVLVAPSAFMAVGNLKSSRSTRSPTRSAPRRAGAAPWVWVAVAVLLAAITYAAATARATSADLMLFWGAKGEKFAQARAVDAAFLGDPEHLYLHPDYPPLWPSLFAFGTMAAGRFAWGASLFTLPFFAGIAALALYGFARPSLGVRTAGELAVVLLALLGFLLIATGCAGNADPPLIAFEVTALSALIFAGDRPPGLAIAGIALAAAVLTKIEGTVFAALVVVATLARVPRGSRRRVLGIVAAPPALALSAWVVFTRLHGLVDVYTFRSGSRLNLAQLPLVLREIHRFADYGVGYAPWFAVAALFVGGRIGKRALTPLAVAVGFAGFIGYMYLTTGSDPTLFIGWSSNRLLITPLTCIFLAAAASDPEPSKGAGETRAVE